ncbi:SMI1/KNR4 family protein [Clostridium estertheticum]|uniref:SMI1/KNR4 family protein n=1 Tax=Clostridium estertheticum TaxID=238834 RepID=UPI001C0CC237|nr:SMI1/KNR4 family protein [Clostridium estertheticum]MBU3174526.1 SMI1/KNR4 family protein [Clostridium estertheticum]MBU3179468.1 SMI1/KNR4 family protein [Clostridium estertheticum]MBW9154800.1 SMI1/KNR4 family protein [Clostridium estertheticum]WLC82516.1 SMI1/KNR4 family protein [Clostridium estertheticum]
MNYNEVEDILASILEKETEILDKPTEDEWKELSGVFNYTFSNEFQYFIELMAEWSFPGDIYNVSKGNTNGNDTIEEVYEHEMNNGNWDSKMIPFYGIGNGDYFCLNAMELNEVKVYYYYDDKGIFEEYSDNLCKWIKDLPMFLA